MHLRWKSPTTFLQYIVPQHALSRLFGKLATCKIRRVKNTCIKLFIYLYKVDLSEALKTDLAHYQDFNSFFTRLLHPKFRPIAQNPQSIVSPCDGTIYELGHIDAGQIIQAKGHSFQLCDLLGGDPTLANQFENGTFATSYLAPSNYHRVHMPFSGHLKKMIYVPGKLFSVNAKSNQQISGLFARNERVICLFETTIGPMVVILVGALLVGSIHTVWASAVNAGASSNFSRQPQNYDYLQTNEQKIFLNKGEELGYFQMGSTVITLFTKGAMQWNQTTLPGKSVYYGEEVGQVRTVLDIYSQQKSID